MAPFYLGSRESPVRKDFVPLRAVRFGRAGPRARMPRRNSDVESRLALVIVPRPFDSKVLGEHRLLHLHAANIIRIAY